MTAVRRLIFVAAAIVSGVTVVAQSSALRPHDFYSTVNGLRLHAVEWLDMRGHGDSAWSAEGAYLVDDYVDDLEAFVEQRRLRNVSLLGNSTGGRVAQVYAGRHPDRVDKLVVEDVGPERPQSIADAFARQVEEEKNGWAPEDELVARLAARNRRTPERVLRTYAHYGVKRREDGRIIWKRDPNLVKGSGAPAASFHLRRGRS